jgi:putative lipoprotein (rSAM/lipoprotein system)
MKSFSIAKRRLLKKTLLALGVCSAGLVTSCCKYGTLIADYAVQLKGTVKSKDTSESIPGIRVKAVTKAMLISGETDNNGAFSVLPGINQGDSLVTLQFSDIDGTLNGSFQPKDTIIKLTGEEIENSLKEGIDVRLIRNE